MIDRDPLDELVGALARVRDEDLASASDSKAAKALFEEVVSMRVLDRAEATVRRRGLARPRVLAAVVVGLLLLVTAAGYAVSRALTPDEQLSVFDRVSQEIPLPPGGNFELQKKNITETPALEAEEGLAGDLAVAASCQWFGYWLDGYDRADRAQMAAAAATIDQIPSWPQLVEVDPGPGGIVEGLTNVARSVDAGDPSLVRQFLIANCAGEPWADSVPG